MPIFVGVEPTDTAGTDPFPATVAISIPDVISIGAGVVTTSPASILARIILGSLTVSGTAENDSPLVPLLEGVEGMRTVLGTGTGVALL